MRKAEEILRKIPHNLNCPAKTSIGYCNCGFARAKAAIEQAQQEAIEETAKLAKHNQDGSGGEWDSASLAIEEAIRALLSHKE